MGEEKTVFKVTDKKSWIKHLENLSCRLKDAEKSGNTALIATIKADIDKWLDRKKEFDNI